MVAVIKTGHSLSRILNYNENKIKEGVAEGLAAMNYPMDFRQLGFSAKLNRLQNLANQNQNVSRNSIHISINFDPSEKLNKEKLVAIAERYMKGIGLGDQPYLVYRHNDAAHPHIHIVTVKVRPDGSRIDMHNVGRNQSEKVRKTIEREFNLVRAQRAVKPAQKLSPEPASLKPVEYGKKETRKAIATVLDQVLTRFNYTSLPELNAILRLYRIEASPGKPGSRIQAHHGLQYRIIDRAGEKVGVPIKASAFHQRPTLAYLATQFERNKLLREPLRKQLTASLGKAFSSGRISDLNELVTRLAKEGIAVVERRGKEQVLYGLTYIDLKGKSVFNGSELGKKYTAKGIQDRLAEKTIKKPENRAVGHSDWRNLLASLPLTGSILNQQQAATILEILFQEEKVNQLTPYELRQRQNKKREGKKL